MGGVIKRTFFGDAVQPKLDVKEYLGGELIPDDGVAS